MFTFTLFKKTYTVNSLAEASELFNTLRDKSGKGMRTMPLPEINGGEYHFSYNGKIWSHPSSRWTPASVPVYG